MTRSNYRILDSSSFVGEKENVWNRELAYWDLFFNGDPICLEMIADSFLGWPHNAEGPLPKIGIETALEKNRANPLRPIVEPLGISVEDNVAIVHLIRTFSESAVSDTGQSSGIRVLHAWQKRHREWILIGGMGYPG